MNGWPTTSRSGRAIADCSSVGRRPDVDEHTITSSAGEAVGLGEQRALELHVLGCALLHELDAGDRVLDRRAHERSEPSAGSGASVSRAYARRAFASTSSTLRGARVGVVEPHVDAVQQEPRRPAGADHAAAEQADCARASDTHAQRELRPHLLRAEHAHVHRLEDRDGALDELARSSPSRPRER